MQSGPQATLFLQALEEHAPGLSNLITARLVLTPADLEREYGLTEGHPLHGEPGLDQFFAWRPLLGHARYRFGIPGLYLCGAGAHPGPPLEVTAPKPLPLFREADSERHRSVVPCA